MQDIFTALKSSLDLEIPTELPTEIIRVLNSAIRKVNLNKGVTINGNTDKEVQKIFIRLIDQHNSFEGYSKSKHSINNAVVSRIKQVISDPTSQILANSPVDVQSWHDAIEAVLSKKGLEPDSDIFKSLRYV